MLSLTILFLTGLLGMFVAFLKKPALTLFAILAGLAITAGNMYCEIHNPSGFLSQYQGVDLTGMPVYIALTGILFTALLIIAGYEQFKLNPDHTGDYMALMVFSLLGAILMVSFTNMFVFFLGLEILSIPVYVLAGSKKSDALSSESSLKYFITGAFATGILLFGIAWVYGATGTFEVDELRAYFDLGEISSLAYVGILLIMVSFLFKVGAAPFHFWSPDVYDGAPNVITGFMAAVVKLGAIGAFIRFFNGIFDDLHDFWAPALVVLAILTMFVGNLSALRQVRFKRLLAYSSIAHVGYLLIAIIANNEHTLFNAWYYLVAYGFSTIALITILAIVNDKEDALEALRGAGRKNPFIGFVATLALLGLAGVPPLMGFFGKYLIFAEAIQQYTFLIVIALINSAIGIYYYLKAIMVILSKPEENNTSALKVTPLQYLVLVICVTSLLFGGLLLNCTGH